MSYNGWMITDTERARILGMFPPRYPVTKATHVTHQIDDDRVLPCDADIAIVGHAALNGIEALVVSVNGTIFRPDGLIYHITLSVEEGRASKESNDVLALGFDSVAITPIETCGFFSFGEGPYVVSPLTA